MNWDLVWSVVWAVVLGAVTNELCDLAPWMARKVLRFAAFLEAPTRDEADLIHAELLAILEDKPGKLSKLGWSLGRMTYALHFFARRLTTSRAARFLKLFRKFSLVSMGSFAVLSAFSIIQAFSQGQSGWAFVMIGIFIAYFCFPFVAYRKWLKIEKRQTELN